MTLGEFEAELRERLNAEPNLPAMAVEAGIPYQQLYHFKNGGRHIRNREYFDRLMSYYGYRIIKVAA